MEFTDVFHWFVYHFWHGCTFAMACHFPIWLMRCGKWAERWIDD